VSLGVLSLFGDRILPSDPERRSFVFRVTAVAVLALAGGTAAVATREGLARVAVKRVRVPLPGIDARASGYTLVQLTDIHIGPTIGHDFLADVVARVNALEPGAVVITGDLVDGSVEELRAHVAPLADLKAKDGVYFVTGNHEYYSGVDEWIAHLRGLGIVVLRNERKSLSCGVDLAGVDDASAGRFGGGHGCDVARALSGRDPERPTILLAHQPKTVLDAHKHGVALQLSGHTHGGQIFPFNYLVALQQPYNAGLYDHQGTNLYVSCGTGYWGPPMRLAAPAEITEIVLEA
jgi:predicted MPP superfamily phosphohydrolase